MRVAFSTTDGRRVDAQLRRAPLVAVYDVHLDGWALDRVSAFANAQRSADRIAAVAGVAVVFVTAIGPSTAARLAMRGIRPATAAPGTPIEQLLAGVQRALAEAQARGAGDALAPTTCR